MPRHALIAAVAMALALGSADLAIAKDKGNQGKGQKHNSASSVNPGKGNNSKAQGPKAIPPGQIKRYTRGAKLPADVDFYRITDLSRWKLPEPGKGYRYIKVDNEVLKIAEDTQTVIDAIGIVDDLLR